MRNYDKIEFMADINYRLWKSRETVIKMLITRGYDEAEEYSLDYETFKQWAEEGETDIRAIKEALTLIFIKEKKNVLVTWLSDAKLGENLQLILSKMGSNITRAIVIVDVGVTPSAKAIIKTLAKKKIYIDVFTITETQFNLIDHEYIPKHEIKTKKEKKSLLKAYGITQADMPHIKTTDPVIKYLGATKGQLIKITRESDTQPGYKTIAYRIVV